MIMRCKITKICMILVNIFLIPLKPLKKLLSSIKLSRVRRKLEMDKFFLGLIKMQILSDYLLDYQAIKRGDPII